MSEPAACSWAEVSDEVLLAVFGRLGLRDLARAAQVCSSWHRVAQDFHLYAACCGGCRLLPHLPPLLY